MPTQDELRSCFVRRRSSSAREILRKQTRSAISVLNPRDRQVLELHYGLMDGKERTLEEVAKYFSLTCERIRQIEARALGKLGLW